MFHTTSAPLFSRFAENQVNGGPSSPYLEMAFTVFVVTVLTLFIARFTWSCLRRLISKIRSNGSGRKNSD